MAKYSREVERRREREREKGRYLMVDGIDDGKWIGG